LLKSIIPIGKIKSKFLLQEHLV